jgi:hypothetical protein
MTSGVKIRQQYRQALPKLNEVMAEVKDKLRDFPAPDFITDINFKTFSSIKRKYLKDHLKNILEMPDLIRGRLFFSKNYTFEEATKLLKQLFGKNISKIDKKKGMPEYGLQYHGIIHFDLLFGEVRFELQLVPIEFKPYKQFLHSIYEKFKSEKLSDEEKDSLREIHNKLYQDLDKRAKLNRQK